VSAFTRTRKREALGEVTGQQTVGVAAKGKEKDSTGLLPRGGHHDSSTLPTAAGSRQTTAAVGKKASVGKVNEEKEVIIVSDEHAMVVDLLPLKSHT